MVSSSHTNLPFTGSASSLTRMARRVLITGASGLLGRALYREFKRAGDWEVLGLAFSRAVGDLKAVDLKDQTAVKRTVQEFQVKSKVTEQKSLRLIKT